MGGAVVSRARQWAKRHLLGYVPGAVIRRYRPGMTRVLRRPSGSLHPSGIPIYVVIAAWMEEDIIHAAVTHAFEQGADRVFLIDNGSTDRTIDEATAAGAEHLVTHWSNHVDERLRYDLINAQIRHRSKWSGLNRIWWLVIDADEFVTGPHGQTVRQFLDGVDQRCRVVGTRVLDHFPDPDRSYAWRTNPLAVQSNCIELPSNWCPAGHQKHPAILWGNDLAEITVHPGSHHVGCRAEALYEPAGTLVMHHHPYRSLEHTAARLEIVAKRGTWDHLDARRHSIEAVFRGDYANVLNYRTQRLGIAPRPWTEFGC